MSVDAAGLRSHNAGMVRLNRDERGLLDILDQFYQSGNNCPELSSVQEKTGVPAARFNILLKTMEAIGAIHKLAFAEYAEGEIPYPITFVITGKASQLARECREPPDRLGNLWRRARSHKLIAVIIGVILVLVFLEPLVSRVIDFLRRLHLVE